MKVMDKLIGGLVKHDEQTTFFTGGVLTVFLMLMLFVAFKAGDYVIGGHFGHIVETWPWLQDVFQFMAFIGLGLAIHFVMQYRRTKKVMAAREEITNGNIQRMEELTHQLEVMDGRLRDERERYRRIIDTQQEFVTKFLPDGTITFVNRANYTFHGFTHWDQMVGRSIFDFVSRGSTEQIKVALGSVTVGNPKERHIEVMISPKGDAIYVDWINCGIFDENGKLVKFQSVGRDITRYVEEQKQVEQKEKYYRMLFTHMLSGFAVHRIICDDDNRVCDYAFVEVNPAFEKLFGFKKDEVIGKTVLEIMPNTEPDIIIRFGQVAETGVPDVFECHFVDIGKWFQVTAFRPQGDHFAATFIDVTERLDRTGKRTRRTDKPKIL